MECKEVCRIDGWLDAYGHNETQSCDDSNERNKNLFKILFIFQFFFIGNSGIGSINDGRTRLDVNNPILKLD